MKKVFLFYIIFVILLFCSCSSVTSHSQNTNASKPNAEMSKEYGEVKEIATLEDKAINESSGISASRKNAGLFWTHNDSGGGAFIYALDTNGKKRGVWRVAGAENVDWEDMAIFTQNNESYLYIGDIGDNDRERNSIIVYRFVEPNIKNEDSSSTKSNPLQTENAEAFRLEYPDGKHNCETLLVHPTTGDIYLVTKTSKGTAGVYKISNPSASSINKLVKVSDLSVPGMLKGFLTGGDISPDGRRVILCDYFAAFEFVLLANNAKFDDIWKVKPLAVNIGQRQQGEAVCYAPDGKAIYATSEETPTPLFEVRRITR